MALTVVNNSEQDGKHEEGKKKQEKSGSEQDGKESDGTEGNEVSGASSISDEQPLPEEVDAKDFINAVKDKSGENLFDDGDQSPVADIKIDSSLKEEIAKEAGVRQQDEPVIPNEPQDIMETKEISETQEPAREVQDVSLETPVELPSVENETSSTQQMTQESSNEPSDLRDSYVKDEPVTSNEPQVSEEPIVAAENYVENDQNSRSSLGEILSERASSASLTDSLSEEDSSEALCGGKSHRIKENYQDVDYEDFAKEIGHYYNKLDSSEKWYLETQMKRNRWSARKSLEDVSTSSDNGSQHHDLRESNVQHAEVPSAWSERPDFASSPTVSSALFQVE